jgi:hypothetical protein
LTVNTLTVNLTDIMAGKRGNVSNQFTRQRVKSQISFDYETTQELQRNIANLLKSLDDPVKIEKASIRDIASAIGVLFDRLRLQRGESTSNIAISTRSEGVSQIALLTAKLEAVLTNKDVPIPPGVSHAMLPPMATAASVADDAAPDCQHATVKRRPGRPRKVREGEGG